MGQARETRGLPDAARGRAAGRVSARFSLKGFLHCEHGATAVEYGIIVALIFLAVVGGVEVFASNANSMYQHIGTTLNGSL
jgi:pilus assembly protein Flp/PilA